MPSVTDPRYQAALVLFSRELRQIRRQAGDPSQDDLARQIGVAKSTVCRMLQGHSLPKWPVLAKFLQLCGVTDLDHAKAQWIAIRELVAPVDQYDLVELTPAEERERLARLAEQLGPVQDSPPAPGGRAAY